MTEGKIIKLEEYRRSHDELKNSSLTDQADQENLVSIKDLGQLAGFPKEFIKEELAIEKDVISLEELRRSVLNYLNQKIL